MRGRCSNESGEIIGHVWVVDGFRYLSRRIQIVKYPYTNPDKVEIIESHIENTAYNHINWGWNGMDNGYFLYDVFDTSKALSYDFGPRIDKRNYNIYLQYFVIKPL